MAAQQGPVETPATGNQIGRTFFRLRLVMSIVIAGLVLRSTFGAYQTHARITRAVEAEEIARDVARVVVLAGRERGLVALSANQAANDTVDAEIDRVRDELDRTATASFARARALADSDGNKVLASVLAVASERRRAAVATRQVLARAVADANPAAATDEWIDTTTLQNESMIVVHSELLEASAEQSTALRDLVRLRQLTLDAAEHAGQERAILGAALARQERLSSERLRGLYERRGIVEHSLKNLDDFLLSRTPPPELAAAISDTRREFLEVVKTARVHADGCVLVGTPCTLPAKEWFARATGGIDAVMELSGAASRIAAEEIDAAQRAATRSLILTAFAGSIAFALILFASAFVRRRIAQRLLDLRDGALMVAGGALDHPVIVPGSDEVTAVAGAVEQMRTTLNARNQELHELIERLKEAQGQLIQQERLASVGQLAGGVAHEINNPLAIVLGNVAHLLDTLDKEGPAGALDRAELREVLLEVRHATERATTIVRDLRDFAVGGPGTSGRIADLDEAVEAVVSALGASFPPKVRLQLALSAPVPVAGSRGAVAQVLQRLLDNARDACARGGTVTVRTAVEGDHAVLTVEDSGVGIAPELLGRVLEPFFTTKGIGGGTGLGLPVCVGIVRQLGGELTIDSAPGKGTFVQVKLQRAR